VFLQGLSRQSDEQERNAVLAASERGQQRHVKTGLLRIRPIFLIALPQNFFKFCRLIQGIPYTRLTAEIEATVTNWSAHCGM
jgi:hypothetical protein